MKIAIIGASAAAVKCLNTAIKINGIEVVLVLQDCNRDLNDQLLNHAKGIGINAFRCGNINSIEIINTLKIYGIQVLFSINNYQIISQKVISELPMGAINMHASLLPSYAGLNSCSWMILNGENQHGVTWHQITSSLDSGPILCKTSFEVTKNMTAIMAMLEVINKGSEIFGPLLEQLRDGNTNPIPQDGKRSYYSDKDIPFEGWLPINENFETLQRLSRAIDYHPSPIFFFHPRLENDGDIILIESFYVSETNQNKTIGEILKSAEGYAEISIRNGIAVLELVDKKLILKKGSILKNY